MVHVNKLRRTLFYTGGNSACSDTNGVTFSGENCAQFLSTDGVGFACDWAIVKQHCCASRAQYCKGGATPNNPINNNQINNNPINPINPVNPINTGGFGK